VRRFATMMIEPATYLPALLADVRLAGGDVVVRRFTSPDELTTLPEPVIINCTGLGAAELFGDPELVPIKGQLSVLLPQREVDDAVLAGELYMFARSHGILLGGTHERDVATLEPNLEAKQELVAGHMRLFAGLKVELPGFGYRRPNPSRPVWSSASANAPRPRGSWRSARPAPSSA
jgi:D-amino-acid oxidase